MDNTIETKKWYHYICFFYVFCVIGWIYEVIWEYAVGNGFVNRGVLYGPHLPIYGIGVLILYFLFRKLIKKDIKIGKLKITPLIVFIAIMMIVSIVEYCGAVFTEDIMHLPRLWDYSSDVITINGKVIPLNVQGRISLRNSACLSAGAMVMLYFVWPLLEKLFSKIKPKVTKTIAVIIIAVMGIDLFFTFSPKSFTIPENYIMKFEDNMAIVDGPDINFYLYQDKIIVESKSIYPVGTPHNSDYTVTIYENLGDISNITNLTEVRNLIQNKNGKVVIKQET